MYTSFHALFIAATVIVGTLAPSHARSLGTHDNDNTELAASALAGYDALLRAHVDDLGFIDYAALHADPAALHAYVDSLADPTNIPPAADYDARLAALINAYNAFTLQLILDHWDQFESGQTTSITQLHDGKPWDQPLWNLAGQTVSLNQLEHELIRRDLLTEDGVVGAAEPRLHWAVVCAAYSCPPLRAEAYTAADLEAQLADQERRVLLSDDPRFIQTTPAPGNQNQGHRVTAVTQLFNWYGSDFGSPWTPYLQQATGLRVPDTPQFLPYDWQLNAQPNRPRPEK
ncbi:MAG: DUF547 domain-containing protein [Planctomycetota bacterium]